MINMNKMSTEELGKAIEEVEQDAKWWLANKEQVLTEYQFRKFREAEHATPDALLLRWMDKNLVKTLQKRIKEYDEKYVLFANYATYDGRMLLQWRENTGTSTIIGSVWRSGSMLDSLDIRIDNSIIEDRCLTIKVGDQGFIRILARD